MEKMNNKCDGKKIAFCQKTVQTPIHPPLVQANSYVSSFSHSLPGTNSYMSVTRYFNSPPGATVVASRESKVLDLDHKQSHSGDPLSDQAQDYFHPWNPRFKVSLFCKLPI